MLKIFYACDFSLNKSSGKNRATRQKLDALSAKADVDLSIFSVKVDTFSIFSVLKNEILLIFKIHKNNPDVLITRGVSGVLVTLFRKYFKVKLVREVHAAGLEELKLLPFKGIKKWLAYIKLRVSLFLDCKASLRIFNHPNLMNWYLSNYRIKGASSFVYNGFDPSSKSLIDRSEARERFNFSTTTRYLVFTGAASKWHGVNFLVKLQRCFNENGDDIRIVCGGGTMAPYDPEELCINFTPLDDAGCADLIRAGDACLLPVANVRISPGSPLKLYDYILNERPVIAQSDQIGYSDEVELFNIGIVTDFEDPQSTRQKIIEYLDHEHRANAGGGYPVCNVSWSDRMDEWLDIILIEVGR